MTDLAEVTAPARETLLVTPSTPPERAIRRSMRLLRRIAGNRFAGVVLSLGTFVAVWQLATSREWVNPALIPPPTRVFDRLIELLASGELQTDVIASLKRVAVGLTIGTIIGLCLGLLVGRVRAFDLLVDPLIQFLRNLSPTAMIPIAIIWFGIDENSKYFLVIWGTLFFVAINTTAGVRSTPESRLRAAACMGIGRLRSFWLVVLPSALPHIQSGIRLSVSSAFLSLIPAEMLAANEGIGYMLQRSSLVGRTDDIFVALLVIATLGFTCDWIVRIGWDVLLGRYTKHLSAA